MKDNIKKIIAQVFVCWRMFSIYKCGEALKGLAPETAYSFKKKIISKGAVFE